MNIVIVTINQDHAAIASWLAAQDFSGCTGTLANRTTADGCGTGAGCAGGTVATNACGRCPFPPGAFGDELSTRLARRLHGASICR